jgi:hypothetical protein
LKDVNDQQIMNKWHQSKPTWVYQQLLKLYSYQALNNYYNKQQHKNQQHLLNSNKRRSKSNFIKTFIPQIKPWFTIIDSDTIFVQPISLFNYDQHKQMHVPIYNIASPQTGTFINDAALGDSLIHAVFPTRKNMTKAFPNYKGYTFTSITHFMTFHGQSVNHMLETIYNLHDKTDAWKVLSRINAVLSEWELYMAWIMNTKRDTIHVQQIPYVNWGLLGHTNLIQLNNPNVSDIIYLSKHDDYKTHHKCCVNANWNDKFGIEDCQCCEKCDRMAINCYVLGIQGCRDVSVVGVGNGGSAKSIMSFDHRIVPPHQQIKHRHHVRKHGYTVSYNNHEHYSKT